MELVYYCTMTAKCNDGIDRPQFLLCQPSEVQAKLGKMDAAEIPYYIDADEYRIYKEGNHPLFQWAKKVGE